MSKGFSEAQTLLYRNNMVGKLPQDFCAYKGVGFSIDVDEPVLYFDNTLERNINDNILSVKITDIVSTKRINEWEAFNEVWSILSFILVLIRFPSWNHI